MLLHVWDLLSQPEECDQSTLNPFVARVQLSFTAFDFAPVRWSCSLWVRLGAPWSGSFLLCYIVKGLSVGRDRVMVRKWGVGMTLVFPLLCGLSPDLHASSLCFRCVRPLVCTSPDSQPCSVYAYFFPLVSVSPNGGEIREPQWVRQFPLLAKVL